MRVTHRQLGLHLKLDRSTVSRGLRNDPRIPEATRQRIHAAARELGYRPHPLLSELASSRWQSDKIGEGMTIAYIDCTSLEHRMGIHVAAPLPVEASTLGYRLQVFHRRDFSSSAKLQRVLRNRGISDVILGPAHEPSLTVQLDWSKFICVQLLPGFFPLPLHSVVRDHFNNVVLAWRKAVSHGYRRIGVVLLDHPVQLLDDIMRASAVHACQTAFFPDLPVLPPLRHRTVNAAHIREFVKWVKASQPDVIIGFSNGHHQIYRAEFGHDMPYISLHTGADQGLTGIPEEVEVCAREAVNLLHFCRRAHQWGIPRRRIDHVLEPTWFEGNSLPDRNAA